MQLYQQSIPATLLANRYQDIEKYLIQSPGAPYTDPTPGADPGFEDRKWGKPNSDHQIE